MRGKTVSVTIPLPVLDWYDTESKKAGVSRSRLICNDLFSLFTRRLSEDTQKKSDVPNFKEN